MAHRQHVSSKSHDLLAQELHEISVVNDFLHVGGCLAVNATSVAGQNYSAVVCCFDDFRYDYPPCVRDAVYLDLDDTTDQLLTPHFDRVSDLIEMHRKSGGKTLVFCHRGASRSVSFVLAYLMKYQSMNLRQAFEFAQSRRKISCPNAGFFEQLIELEKKLSPDSVCSVKIIKPFPGRPNVRVADVAWRRSMEFLEDDE